MKITYNEYLFSCLLKLFDKEFEQMAYDDQFGRIESKYRQFCQSEYNNVKYSEYDCIINYLKINMKINIADSPIMIKYYYNGNIIYKDKTYCFELDVCENEQEINWLDDLPVTFDEQALIEEQIFKHFNKEI